MPDGRVLVAFDDGPLVASPTWTRLDDTDNLIAGIDIGPRGRGTLADQSDTSVAAVYVNDTDGLFDPANTGSPYFGKLDGKQILLQCWDPVAATWEEQYRGTIDGYGYDINPATDQNGDLLIANVQIDCVDVFEFLAGYGLTPGIDGDTAPAGSEGTVWYDETPALETVDFNIKAVLDAVGIDSTMYVVFTGNIRAQAANYDADESALVVLRDYAEAEFPQIANIYCDRFGRFVFHGRYSRFDPDTVSGDAGPSQWDFQRWRLGDGKAIAADATRGQMRVLAYKQARANVINAVVCYPKGIDEADIAGQIFKDDTSIADYGKRALPPIGDLLVLEGTTTSNDANTESLKYAEFLVTNQKDPRVTIDLLTVKAIDPLDHRAEETWGVLTKADISDIVNLKVGYPGGVGIGDPDGEDYFIESVTKRIRPLVGSGQENWHDYVEVDLGVSPAEWSMDTHGVFA